MKIIKNNIINYIIKSYIEMIIEVEEIIILRNINKIKIIIIIPKIRKEKQQKEIEKIKEKLQQVLELKERKRVNIQIIKRKGIGVNSIINKIKQIMENEKRGGILIKRYIKYIKKRNKMIKGIEVTLKGRLKTGRGITRSTKEKFRIGKIKKSTYDFIKHKAKLTVITKVGAYTIRVILTHSKRNF